MCNFPALRLMTELIVDSVYLASVYLAHKTHSCINCLPPSVDVGSCALLPQAAYCMACRRPKPPKELKDVSGSDAIAKPA